MTTFDDALAAARALIDTRIADLSGSLDSARADLTAALAEGSRSAAAIATLTAQIAQLEAQLAAVPGPYVGPVLSRGLTSAAALTATDGDVTVTTPGTVLEGLLVTGYLRVKAAGVRTRNCRVVGRAGLTGEMALVQSTSAGFVMEDTEIAAAFPTWGIDGFVGSNVTMRRVDVHGVVDCVKLIGGAVLLEDSWLHDNLHYDTTPAGHDTHSDSVQIGAGDSITIRRTLMTGATNAAVMVTQDNGPVSNLTVTGCELHNGAATLNVAEKSYGPVKGLRVTDNLFGADSAKAGFAIITPKSTSDVSTIAGNTYPDGSLVKVTRG